MENCKELNILDTSKLTSLLLRFYYAIYSEKYIFVQDEKEKMQTLLNLTNEELCKLLNIIKNIIIESVQNTIHPQTLKTKLVSGGMQETLAEVFSKLWAENGKMVVGKLKKNSLANWQLKGLSWEFHAETASINTARQKCPITVMDFNIYEPAPLFCNSPSDYEPKGKNVVFQMDKEDLLQFYNELEKIQSQLDFLNS